MSEELGKRKREVQEWHKVAKRSLLDQCDYWRQCSDFLDSLNLDRSFLDVSHHRCYCAKCGPAKNYPATMSSAGQVYETPQGFSGFGIKVPARADALQVFEKWHVSYHGLRANDLGSVLSEGSLLMPGDELLDGSYLKASTRGDHSRLFTSPSALYAEMDLYTKPVRFRGKVAKVLLQCRQKPGYDVIGETVGWAQNRPGASISPHIPNSVLERRTRCRSSIIPFRILVKLEDPPLIVPPGCMGQIQSFAPGGDVTVSWPHLGECLVPTAHVSKCSAELLLKVGDIVRPTVSLFAGGGIVNTSTIGSVVRLEPFTVEWHGTHQRQHVLHKDYVIKCDPAHYLAIGDVVRARSDLRFADGVSVRAGSLGEVRELEGQAGMLQITWDAGEPGRAYRTEQRSVVKCGESEFVRSGDVVRLKRDVAFSDGSVVRAGQLGRVAGHAERGKGMLSVTWQGQEYSVRVCEVDKCAESEFLKQGDWIVPKSEIQVATNRVLCRADPQPSLPAA